MHKSGLLSPPSSMLQDILFYDLANLDKYLKNLLEWNPKRVETLYKQDEGDHHPWKNFTALRPSLSPLTNSSLTPTLT